VTPEDYFEKENEYLKNRLLYYENPNTPPSARQIEKADKTPTENYQYIASLLATARLQGKNGFEELDMLFI
jgi:hypothetical protein